MADLQQLEFFLLRYVGDATRGERINLGVVAVGANSDQVDGFVDARFVSNWTRLRCFDPLVDIEELRAIESEIRKELQDPATRSDLLRRLSDSWSNVVCVDPLQGCVTESPAVEMERLCAQYLATPVMLEKRELGGRQRILSMMRDELEKAGVLPLLEAGVSIAEYTKAGDPLKLDFGYKTGEDYKFLQAVSLATNYGITQGMMLAGHFLKIKQGIREKRGLNSWLTAIVDDDLPARDEMDFTVHLLEENGIAIARVSDMHHVANGIRLDLTL